VKDAQNILKMNRMTRRGEKILMDQDQNKDLGTQGQEDKLKGKVNEAAGKVQKKVGQVTGDTSTEAKGAARELGGKVQSKAGGVEKDVDRKLDDDRRLNNDV
jgi:uncharacterized protein YjbJ (UPF0337 family)